MNLADGHAQPRETELTDKEFLRLAAIAASDAGLALPDTKRQMVQSRLAGHVRKSGFASFKAYISSVEATPGSTEREKLISLLTTNVSSFFRENHHFETLKTDVFPDLITRARAGKRVRLWSAGCSTGQEPYSLAMLALSMDSGLADYDFRILASDIDREVLRTALTGEYSQNEADAIPDAMRTAFLGPADTDVARIRIGPAPRELIVFRQLNLVGKWPIKGQFDVIFCRNVVIYFDETVQATLWPRFADALVDGGWFFLGHSERLSRAVEKTYQNCGVTTFRKLPLPRGA